MLQLTPAQRRDLRSEAHHLDPVVSIAGNGLTDSVLKEIDVALNAHGLIKIRVYGDDRNARAHYLAEICLRLGCAAVQSIGKLLVVFRPKLEEKPAVIEAPVKRGGGRTTRKPKPVARSAAEQRPGRPTTTNAPRKALRGEPAKPRYRKAPAGSGRARKSAR